MARVLILGATSAIAQGAAHAFAKNGDNLVLAGRDQARLDAIAADLALRYGVTVTVSIFDACKTDAHSDWVRDLHGDSSLRGVLLAFGSLDEEQQLREDARRARALVETNLLAPMTILNPLARYFAERGSGFIAVIGSVAGDRGRQSNYMYGATKAGLATLVEGLAHRLAASRVRVVLIKPGFVDTPMTYGRPGMFMIAEPDLVGQSIVRACERGPRVVYVPGFWRWIMAIIKALPAIVFHKTSL